MSTAFMDDEVTSPTAAAHAAVDALADLPLDLLEVETFLGEWREVERLRNRLASLEHGFIAQAEARQLPAEFAAKNTAAFVRGLLRVDPYEAAARVRAADAAASRTTLTGEPQPAPFKHVAAAQAAGTISPKHASVVVQAVERLTPDLQAEHGVQVEADLVHLASQFDPAEVAKLGQRMTTLLDQDGALRDAKYRERNRALCVHQRPDGSSQVTGEATVELTEYLLTILDAQAKPRPEADGTKDPRTPGQRNHDALLDTLKLVTRAELLPDAGGVTTTVVLIATDQAWESDEGVAITGHGAVLAIPDAIRLAGDTRLTTVTLDRDGAVGDWTDTRRLFTENQRLALAARDGGCSFPGCDTPPAWCQAAHITDWIHGGPTTVDNGMLLCGHHHRNYERLGWHPTSEHGVPAWIPPPWIDPDRRPRRNPANRVGGTGASPSCPVP